MTTPLDYQEHHNGPLKPEVAAFLDELRIKNNWTYKALGERLGISQGFAHNIVQKHGNISTNTYMARMAHAIEKLKNGDMHKAGEPAGETQLGAMREHGYHLRDDLQVVLRLPANLTEREAERLAMFIRSLAQ